MNFKIFSLFFLIQIGINPGLFAAYKGHHYAGPGNHFCNYILNSFVFLLAPNDIYSFNVQGNACFLPDLYLSP